MGLFELNYSLCSLDKYTRLNGQMALIICFEFSKMYVTLQCHSKKQSAPTTDGTYSFGSFCFLIVFRMSRMSLAIKSGTAIIIPDMKTPAAISMSVIVYPS